MKSLTTPTRNEFVEQARTYLDTPFRHQGRDRRGVDCLGLLVCIGRDFGFEIVDNLRYSRSPNYQEMRAGLLNHMDIISQYKAEPGDVYWITWPRTAYPMHLAIVIDGDRILHADGSPRISKVVEHGLSPVWRSSITLTLRWNIWSHG